MRRDITISELNERQKLFARLVSFGTAPDEAARKAGYKRRGIENELLKNEKIASAIEGFSGECAIADSSEILKLLTSVMRGDVHDPVVVVEQKTGANGKTQRKARVINKSASVKERMSAAEMLARRYGILETEKEDSGVILFGEDAIVGVIDDTEN